MGQSSGGININPQRNKNSIPNPLREMYVVEATFYGLDEEAYFSSRIFKFVIVFDADSRTRPF